MRRVALAVLLLALAGCDRLPGRPIRAARERRPTEVTSFDDLYRLHCAGCHGDDGRLGPARPLNDPLYQAVISDDALTRITAAGVPGSLMPGFAISSGGELTDDQVQVVVRGMRERWSTPAAFKGQSLPAYEAKPAATSGTAIGRGRRVFESACSGCHGPDGSGGPEAGSIIDRAFLELMTDQALRSTVIAGRIDLGMPDYRRVDDGGPLSALQIADVVAWIRSHERPSSP
jgi:cytochrome c oxidase cbb3-type subunit 3